MKRLISILLSLSMVLSMMAPAFAADGLTTASDPAQQQDTAPAALVYEYEAVPRDHITDIVAGSQETQGEDTPAERAFDGNPATIWHTKWDKSGEKTIQWSLTEATPVGRIVYIGRSGSNRNGAWQNFTVKGLNTEGQWVDLAANKTFGDNEMHGVVDFAPVTVTALKVVVNQGYNGFACAAEIQTFAAVPQQANGVSKQALRDRYTEAAAIPAESYTQASRDALQEKMTAARAVLDRTDATAQDVASALAALEAAMQSMQVDPGKLAPAKPAGGTTQGQPFLAGESGNSANFRIPSIITLKHQKDAAKNGRLVAAIDARWNHTGDACALDTILSVSDDNGANWTYSFPNYFNDSTDQKALNATAFIDPVMVEGMDGTIYMMVDLYPGGVAINTAPRAPAQDTGYRTIDGAKRLVLYNGVGGAQNKDNYTYYVGDFSDGYAPVIAKGDTTKTAKYYVDAHYYLYTSAKAPMYCQQLGSEKFVVQNVFFENADLHVRDATYLWLITSVDGGDTWGDPVILNPQIRPETGTQKFYGVGPGAGLSFVAADGTNVIMLEAYTFSDQKTSFIYTVDGKNWKRAADATPNNWSSESALVQIDASTARQFYRDGSNNLNYTDYTWNSDTQEFVRGNIGTVPGAKKTSNNQLSAIRYSKLVNGKPLFLLSTANGGGGNRTNGHIYALSLNTDGVMEVLHTYRVPNTAAKYGYSSLTEMEDGRVALLYEGPLRAPANGSLYEDIHFEVIDIHDLVPAGAEIGNSRQVEVPLYGTAESNLILTAEQLAQLNAEKAVKAEVTGDKTVFTGLQSGTVEIQLDADSVLKIIVTKTFPEKEIALNLNEITEIEMNDIKGSITFESNPAAVKAVQSYETVYRAQGNIGADANFNAGIESLVDSMYTFTDQKDGTYTVQGTTADGQKVYLSMRHAATGTTGYPFHTDRKTVIIRDHGEGKFSLHDRSDRDGYLYFWKSGAKNLTFDINSSYAAGNCDFELYKLADGTDGVITGYEKLNSMADIVSGEKYLIVSVVGNARYALHPSTNTSNKFAHVIKIGSEAYEPSSLNLVLEGKQAGEAVVVAGGTAYKVTVTDPKPAEPAKLSYASLSLGGNIGVNFFYEFSEDFLADETARVEITLPDGEVIPVKVSEGFKDTTSVPGQTLYKFTAKASARQMTDEITLKVMQGTEQVGETKTYTVRENADGLLQTGDAKTKQLVRTMLYHGAAMQKLKGHHTEKLATAGLENLTELDAAAEAVTTKGLYVATKSGEAPAGLSLYGVNLSLKDETTLRFFFKKGKGFDLSKYIFNTGDYKHTVADRGDFICVEIDDIAASRLDEVVTLKANDLTVTYSPLTYARSVMLDGTASAELDLVARSLVMYNAAANDYAAK